MVGTPSAGPTKQRKVRSTVVAGFANLQDFLKAVEADGQLVRVKGPVDLAYEASAVARALPETAIIFEDIVGVDMPLAMNVFGNYRMLELAFGVDRSELLTHYMQLVQTPIPPNKVKTGPVKDVILTGDECDLTRLPNPIYNELDGGNYIDAAIALCHEPSLGHNLSIQRLQVTGPRRMGIWSAPSHHLSVYYSRAEEKNQPLEVAFAIGCDPYVQMASQVYAATDLDEYDIAGALRGAPIDLVKCETLDVWVPAEANIVVEAVMLPHVRELEGPFGEFPGYYGGAGMRPVLEVKAITYRSDALCQGIRLGKPPAENVYMTALPKAAEVYRLVKQVVAEVVDVYFPPGGTGKYHCVVSIKKRADGEGKAALLAMLASRINIKHAVVVDDDIDIHNPHDVEWAIATRSQFDKDSVVALGAPHNLDPSVVEQDRDLTTKVGIDATKPLDVDYPEAIDVPAWAVQQVRERWSDLAITRGGEPEPRPSRA
jgi:2,5-furandicarboxylate decarboxylase 1